MARTIRHRVGTFGSAAASSRAGRSVLGRADHDGGIQARIARQADELILFAKQLGALRAEKAASQG